MVQKAGELCSEVKALGTALFSALEKRDAEELALLRSTHELKVLNAVQEVKQRQIEEAKEALKGLKKSRELAETRHKHYSTLLSGISTISVSVSAGPVEVGATFSLSPMNEYEVAHLLLTAGSLGFQLLHEGTEILAAPLHWIPETKAGGPTTAGTTFGGSNIAALSTPSVGPWGLRHPCWAQPQGRLRL